MAQRSAPPSGFGHGSTRAARKSVPKTAAGKADESSGTRRRLIEEAERLFAVRGFAGVSLREIGVAAGARNNSAAQYHFGDRQGLVDAVFDHRMAAINERRLALLATLDTSAANRADVDAAGPAADPADPAGPDAADLEAVVAQRAGAARSDTAGDRLRELVTAMVVPLAETYQADPHSTYYARFTSQVMADPALVESIASLDRPVQAGLRAVYVRIAKTLAVTSKLPKAVIDQRLRLASTLFVRALADYEADRDAGMPIPVRSFPEFVAGLVDAIAGLLRAPHTGTCRSWSSPALPTATGSSRNGRHPNTALKEHP